MNKSQKFSQNKSSKKQKKEAKTLLIFLKKTKKGEYAEIEKSSLKYSRLSNTISTLETEEEYHYSLS